MTDTVVMVLTGLLALGVPAWTLWGIWRNARHTPTRQRALTDVLGSITGTALLGLILPAALMGALDPFPIWLIYAVITACAATVLAWRWPALPSGRWPHPALVTTACLLIGVLSMAGIAVT